MSKTGQTPLPLQADREAWSNFFSDFKHIVLVANSDEVDVDLLKARFPDRTIFLFFNKVYKVLDNTFTQPALLVSRSGMMGANIVHRREVAEVTKHFSPESFHGILNIVIGNNERFSEPTEFGDFPVAHLDLETLISSFYPRGMVPTTGFAICIWLRELKLTATITLAGFSARRSIRWKVFDIHDWTFEQVVLRLLFRKGEIDLLGADRADRYAALLDHFPEFSAADISSTVDQVLSERFSSISAVVDHLMSVTKPLRFLDQFYRKHRPKTRKERYIEENKCPKGPRKT